MPIYGNNPFPLFISPPMLLHPQLNSLEQQLAVCDCVTRPKHLQISQFHSIPLKALREVVVRLVSRVSVFFLIPTDGNNEITFKIVNCGCILCNHDWYCEFCLYLIEIIKSKWCKFLISLWDILSR